MSIKRRILHGIGANGFGQAVTLLIQLASVPIMINAWGVELYGEWIALSAIPAYLVLSNLGLTATAGNSLAMEAEKGDQLQMQKIYQSTWVMVNSLCFGILFLLVALILCFNLKPIFGFTLTSDFEFKFTLIALLANVAMSMQTGIFEIAFRAIKKNPFAIFFSNSIRLLEWVAATVAVLLGEKFLIVALSMLLVRLLGNLCFWFVLYISKCPLKIGTQHASFLHVKRLMHPAIATMCFPLGLSLSMQGIILLISNQMGSTAVALFSIYRTFTRFPLQLGNAITLAVGPEISYLVGNNNYAQAKQLVRNTQLNCTIIGLLTTVAINLLGEKVINLWIATTVEHNSLLLLTLSLAAFAHMLLQPVWVAQMAINKHIQFAILFLGMSSLTLVLAWTLIKSFGLNGVGCAILTAESIMAFMGFITFNRHFRCQK